MQLNRQRSLAVALLIAGLLLIGWTVWPALRASLRNQTGADAGSPRLQVIPPEHTVEYSKDDPAGRRIEFRLRNPGRSPLQILEVSATCGCTMPEGLSTSELGPGEEISLYVQADPPARGARESQIRIRTDSIETPRVTAFVQLIGEEARIPYFTRLSPQIDLVAESRATEVRGQLEVSSREISEEEPWIAGWESTTPEVVATLLRVKSEEPMIDGTCYRHYAWEILATSSSELPTTEAALKPLFRVPNEDNVPPVRVVMQWPRGPLATPAELLVRINDDATFPIRKTVVLRGRGTDWSATAHIDGPNWLIVKADDAENVGDWRLQSLHVEVPEAPESDSPVGRGELWSTDLVVEYAEGDFDPLHIPLRFIFD